MIGRHMGTVKARDDDRTCRLCGAACTGCGLGRPRQPRYDPVVCGETSASGDPVIGGVLPRSTSQGFPRPAVRHAMTANAGRTDGRVVVWAGATPILDDS